MEIASAGRSGSLDEQQKADIEQEFDDQFAYEELDADERRQELAKLFKMEKHERAGHCLELLMLRHLNGADPRKRRLQYKAGQTVKDVIASQDPESRKVFDEFFIDNAIRDHLDQLLCPLAERVTEVTQAVGSLRSQAQLGDAKIAQNAQAIETLRSVGKRATDLETALKSQNVKIERFMAEQEAEAKSVFSCIDSLKPRLQGLEY